MLSNLNPAQRDVVCTDSGPLLVLAGAGTGKTRVVTFRIARLISRGIDPERIVAVTFTNKAAAEMQSRVGELLRKKTKKKPLVSTFHSLCLRILRRHIHHLGYPKRFAIYTRGDQESIARNVLREIRVSNTLLRPGDLLQQISRWKMHNVRPDQASTMASSDREHLAAMGYRRYQTTLKSKGAVDFDDLLLCTEELFQARPDMRTEEAGRFDHVLVDEYQDTNGSQYRIVKALAEQHRNLCVVGDDDQSVYAWRGAEVKHILNFRNDWPDAKVILLEENYRSTEAILQLANRLIAFNSVRYDKVLRAARTGGEKPRILQHQDETAEAREVVADIRRRLAQPGTEPRDIAILFRTNEQPRGFEGELRLNKLPYVLVGSSSFYDRKEVRDVMAYLRVLEAPRDELSLLRVFNVPPRGIGEKTASSLLEAAVQQSKSFWDILVSGTETAALPDKTRQSIERFTTMIQRFRARLGNDSLSRIANELIREADYRAELRRQYPEQSEQETRWAAVEEIINALSIYEKDAKNPSLGEFLDGASLMEQDFEPDKEKKLRGNAIALMTLHSAKGLEFPQVYMVGLEEGILPHHRSVDLEGEAIDEERRLCYVGITRAQERLTLSLCLSRRKWGKPRASVASRFLYELTGQAENPRFRKDTSQAKRKVHHPPSKDSKRRLRR